MDNYWFGAEKAWKIDNPNTNHEGPSIDMEIAVIREIVPCWNNSFEIKLMAYCHDRDGIVSKVFCDNEWKYANVLDIDHGMLSFGKSIEKINGWNSHCL